MNEHQLSVAFCRLVNILDELREKCPWDKKQTIHSLRNLTIEETFELAEAILEEDVQSLKEELGDVLLHIIFYSKIARENQWFDLIDVLEGISDKLVKRHPHVYSDTIVSNEDEVKQNWEKIKQKEHRKGLLDGVPKGLPAMVKAFRLQEKTSQVGFEWENIGQVWNKVEEEIGELKDSVTELDAQKIEEEYGDLLFSLINYARFLHIDPEAALEKCNKKFMARFEYIEKKSGRALSEMNLEEMDKLWNDAKIYFSEKKI